jgi:heterodisulfide reductase subunit B
MHMSTLAVAESLGIELLEPEGWTCCGATAAHQTDRVLAASLAAANLAAVGDMGLDMVTYCAACYNRMKTANHDVSNDSVIRDKVGEALGRDYDGSVKVRHFVEILMQDIGIEAIEKALKLSLNGLKVACYYGCLLVRPPEVTKFDDPENPTCLEKLIDAMGGESLEWPGKLECCGGGLSLSRTDVVVKLTDKIIGMAKESGADCIAVSCPMCQVNLDLRQLDIKKELGKTYDLPVIYITQLLGLCLGVDAEKLGFEKLMIAPTTVLETVGAAV